MNWNGLLLVDKPSGCTSHDVVDQVRRLFKMSSVGHSGTLDPLASGLMVVLLGQATKLSDFILAQNKRYRVTMELGLETDSGDRDGQILKKVEVEIPRPTIEEQLLKLQGELDLLVPIFSATRVKGKKLYEYARAEKSVEAPRKRMTFFDVAGLTWVGQQLQADVSCGKGGYIRSWVTALGEQLGVGATVMELRRLGSGAFTVDRALTLEQIETALSGDNPKKALESAFLGMNQALPDWHFCSVKGREEQLLRNGQISHDLTNRLVVVQKQAHASQSPVGIKVLDAEGELVGLLEASIAQGLKIRRIFASSPV